MDDSITIVLDSRDVLSGVCGANDGNLRVLEGSLGGRIAARGNEIRFDGADGAGVRRFKTMIDSLIAAVKEGESPSPEYVRALAGIRGFSGGETSENPAGPADRLMSNSAGPFTGGLTRESSGWTNEKPAAGPVDPMRESLIHIPQGFKNVFPRGQNQAAYIKGMRTHDICFCVGPAGTGKTYLAIAEALNLVLSRKIRKLVLTRPVVEAGESLGFLPGDLAQKISPYLRPLYDAMEAMIPYEMIRRMEDDRVIEIAPLAYMRGRSLNDAMIILDEAQNTTKEQMKMFLTRIGEGARVVITGDTTQIDLPKRVDSGLLHAISILSGVEGLYFAYLNTADVVRHPLIKKIIQAYDDAASPNGEAVNKFPIGKPLNAAQAASKGTYDSAAKGTGTNNEKK
ncbi:phosphate starvation protein PhoH [Spirochaetia bacterium]|nr:phosphate starvation protein PhoH [Spirochaetia bacterium]GHV81807.1 phosphate starvation protein PhoH [Spirochaetia bacterium]